MLENVKEEDAGSYICSANGEDIVTILQVSGVVPRFRGRRDSYAVVPTTLAKTAYTDFDLDVKFKPEADNGKPLEYAIERNSICLFRLLKQFKSQMLSPISYSMVNLDVQSWSGRMLNLTF